MDYLHDEEEEEEETTPETRHVVNDHLCCLIVVIESVNILMLGLEEFRNVQDDGGDAGGKNVGENPHPGAVGHL